MWIGLVLLYICFGMITSIVISFIRSVAGDPLSPRVVLGTFVLWPLFMCALFAAALEEEL